jgi:diadenosine tetraphosphate (Ap4A) HIT family hydrolase
MTECLFCKMVSGEIIPKRVFEDDDVLAFHVYSSSGACSYFDYS